MTEPCTENICAVIVTFNPDRQFRDRLATIMAQTASVVIIDNSANGEPDYCDADRTASCHIIRNRANAGVATALNQGFQWALARGFAWVITFDQDTWADSSLVRTYREIFNGIGDRERIGMIGANFLDARGRLLKNGPAGGAASYAETDYLITSGTLMPLALYRDVGPFRDDYFIDYVDIEYCLRLRARGYAIFISTAPLITHSIGSGSEHSLLGLRPAGTTNHPAARRYYMVRNLVVMAREYLPTFPASVLRLLLAQFKHVVTMLCFEQGRLHKLGAVLRGVRDGITGRLGSRSAP
jgi:rhamnosyltransferase